VRSVIAHRHGPGDEHRELILQHTPAVHVLTGCHVDLAHAVIGQLSKNIWVERPGC
jgi:hypothetical protein